MSKIIKLMPDYDCYSVWISENGGLFENVNPVELDLSNELQKKIDDWENQFELTLNKDNPLESDFSTTDDELNFEREGVSIWKEMIRQLPDEDIIYFSVIDNVTYTQVNYPR